MKRDQKSEIANILLVDDRPENLLALESILGDLGCTLIKADSGREALRCCLQQDFAAILLDVQMPGMDGFEAARLIRERDRSQHTPIIFLTAIGKSEENIMQGYSVGAVDYLLKPFVPEVLRWKVAVFVDLFLKTKEVERQARQLAASNRELEAANLQLQAINSEMESFSYSVSHDLRAPLRSIEGFSNALLEDHAASLDAEAADHLNRIVAATGRMNQMIEALLTLSRVSRGELQRGKVGLSELAQDIYADLRRRDPARAERVEFVVAPGLSAEGDPRLLRIALENLLGNAWKYTGKHPTARIEFGSISDFGLRIAEQPISDFGFRIAESPQSAIRNPQLDGVQAPVFFVKDDGAGFDPGFAERLFVPFQRLHTREEFEGLGIGLSTVQRIIHRHGGKVWAEGEVEKGAAFYFTLGQL